MLSFIELIMALNGVPSPSIFQLGKRCMATSGYGSSWGCGSFLNAALVEQVRTKAGGNAQPSLVIIDSLEVKLGQKGGMNRASTASKR